MTKLDRAWWAWRAPSKTERAQFLVLLREAYGRERAAAVRKRGNAAHGIEALGLPEFRREWILQPLFAGNDRLDRRRTPSGRARRGFPRDCGSRGVATQAVPELRRQ